MTDIKRIDIAEFKEAGYLQEANRQFFHPLGLALEIVIDEDSGDVRLGGVWDCRDDPEGVVFHDLRGSEAERKARTVEAQRQRLLAARVSIVGNSDGVQPIGHFMVGGGQ